MKKMKGKDGGVLVMVMVVMLAFSVLAIGLFKLHDTDALETVYVKHTAQAFWVAEAGLQRILDKLRSNKAYREGVAANSFYEALATEETDMVGNGSYVAAVWYNSDNANFVIQSLGTVRQASRKLSLKAVLSDIGDHGLVGLGKGDSSGSTIKKDCTLNCSIYQNGDLTVSAGTTISGNVYADNHDNFANGTALAEDQVLDLSIDTNVYSSMFLMALTTPLPASGGMIELAGYANNTLVVDSSVSPTNLIFSGTGTGAGTLIVKGDQTFQNPAGSNVQIGSDINIFVDGTLEFKKDTVIGNNVHIYVTGDVKLSKDSTVSTGVGCSLLVLGDLTIKKKLQFQGLIFAEGHITVDMDLNVTGTMIAGKDYELKKNAVVTFNAGVIPEDVRDNMIISTYFVQSSIWNELPVN